MYDNLHETAEEKNLGIVVRYSLSATTQCAEAAKKAMRILGMVRRQFKDMDKECFTLMYRTFIKPRRSGLWSVVTLQKTRRRLLGESSETSNQTS